MTSTELLGDIERYLVDAAARQDPYPLYERLRATAGAVRTRSNTVIFSRYHDVHTILTSNAFGVDLQGGAAGPIEASPDDYRYLMMSFFDPPDHTRLRLIVTRHFTPSAMKQHRSSVVQTVRSMLPPADEPDFDLVAGFAHELPINVTCTMLGIPQTEVGNVRYWTECLSRHLETMGRPRDPRTVAAQRTFAAYATGLVAGSEVVPGPLRSLRQAFAAGQLDAAQLAAYVMLLLVSGRETVTNTVGTAVLTLMRHPEQAMMLREHPQRIRDALEECVRYESPVHVVARFTRQATTVGDTELARGDLVLALIGAANRDEERFSNASQLDIGRDTRGHLGFGAGPHYCLGAALARMEGEIVLGELFGGARRITPRCDLRTSTWRDSLPFRGPAELRVGLSRV